MYKRLILAIYLLNLFFSPVHAAEVDLFRADIPVQAEGKQLRPADARRALAQVLIRITGSSAMLARNDVQQALADAGNLVFRYRFYQQENGPDHETETRVEVGFDPAGVRDLIQRLSLPWWPSRRPELLWLVVQDLPPLRSLMNAESLPVLAEALQTASERGLPLTLPLLDLQDQQQLSAVELWGGFTDGLEQARLRYGTDGWLLLRLDPLQQAWRARWDLYLPQADRPLQIHWENIDTDLASLLSRGIDQAATRIAQKQAILLSEQQAGIYPLRVDQLHRLQDWGRLENWLLDQPWVEDLELMRLHQGMAHIRVHITTSRATAEQALSDSGLLRSGSSELSSGTTWSWIAQ